MHASDRRRRARRGPGAPRPGRCLVAAALVASACGAPEPGVPRPSGDPGVVRVAAGADRWPDQGSVFRASRFAFPMNAGVYETLVELNPDYTTGPGLAERWEFIEPRTWRFHLRERVFFHTGAPLTADDVVWSLGERLATGNALSNVVQSLRYNEDPSSVRKVDDRTVDFTPPALNRRLPEQLSHPLAGIVQKGFHFDTVPPSGTGPWEVEEYEAGARVILRRHDGYRGGPPGPERIAMTFLSDAAARVEALRRGDVDVALDVPPSRAGALEREEGLKVLQSPPGRTQVLFMKMRGDAPFDLTAETAVRRAISLAIDKEAFSKKVLAGRGEAGRTLAPPSVLGEFAGLVQSAEPDPGAAIALLEEAGFAEGSDGIRRQGERRLQLSMIAWAEVPRAAAAELAAQLKRIGIDLKFRPAEDQPQYRSFYNIGEFDLDLEIPGQFDADPSFLPVLRFHSGGDDPLRREIGRYFAPGESFDALAEAALAAPTTEAARELSARMIQMLINEAWVIVPLAAVPRIAAVAEGVEMGPLHPSPGSQSWAGIKKAALRQE